MRLFLFVLITCTQLCATEVELEVLGSGGPEIDARASTSYIVWIDKKARLLVDAGSGSMLRFEQSGAKLEDLEAIVLTHMHIDHCVDLPSYIKAGYFSNRVAKLPIIGPSGNRFFPDIETYLEILFGRSGAYRYMADVLREDSDSFQIVPIQVDTTKVLRKKFKRFTLETINVHHGNVPAIAVRINVEGKSIVISGDTNNRNKNLEKLARSADVFVAHHAVAEFARGYATELHMTPSIIASVARSANVQKVLLTHRMKRTLGSEAESLKVIKNVYKANVHFAEDRMRVKID